MAKADISTTIKRPLEAGNSLSVVKLATTP